MIRALWRNETLNAWTESALLRDFGSMLAKADHKFRADKLLYEDNAAAALRAGPGFACIARRK
jgi:soluble lytic murein transglycosylase